MIGPFGPVGAPASPWRVAGLPAQKMPLSQYDVVNLDGTAVLRVQANASYGNLVHPLQPPRAGGGTLAWRWRVDRALERADLRRKQGDDTAAKVCALFDLPLAQVPFTERMLLRLARQRSGEALPAATVCYVWDATLPPGTQVVNAYSPRLRYVVLRGGERELGLWHSERRDIGADFLRLFGDESREVPALLAVAVGADADNTQGQTLAYIADLQLQ